MSTRGNTMIILFMILFQFLSTSASAMKSTTDTPTELGEYSPPEACRPNFEQCLDVVTDAGLKRPICLTNLDTLCEPVINDAESQLEVAKVAERAREFYGGLIEYVANANPTCAPEYFQCKASTEEEDGAVVFLVCLDQMMRTCTNATEEKLSPRQRVPLPPVPPFAQPYDTIPPLTCPPFCISDGWDRLLGGEF